MKKIFEFIKSQIEIFIVLIVVTAIILISLNIHDYRKKSILILDRENPALQNINKTLTFQLNKYKSKILILEAKINDMDLQKKQLKNELTESLQELEYQVVRAAELTQDTSIIEALDKMIIQQDLLIENFATTIILKDSIIEQKDSIVESYVLAVDGMTNEIERLHAENNELLINEKISKGKIKKRNRIIVVGGSIVAAGITTVILLNK